MRDQCNVETSCDAIIAVSDCVGDEFRQNGLNALVSCLIRFPWNGLFRFCGSERHASGRVHVCHSSVRRKDLQYDGRRYILVYVV